MTGNPVLVLDGDSREAVAIVRSLGRNGLRVFLATERRYVAAAFSKYVSKLIICPSPRSEGFMAWLRKVLMSEKFSAMISVRDDTTRLLVDHGDEVSGLCGFAVPEKSGYLRASNKMETMKLAQELGVPAPRTMFNKPTDVHEVEREVGFPCVIKPKTSSGSRGIGYISKLSDFMPRYKAIVSTYGEAIIQERIPREGTAYGASMLFNRGKPRALFAHRRLREYPPTGGPSTLREGVHHPDVEKYATRLLTALKWHGVAMVEFKVDTRDNMPKLMEINPRFWGSLQLGISSGVDFPFLLYRLITDGDIEPVMDYREGVRCRWLLFGDILWYLESEGKMKNLKEFLKFKQPGVYYDIASLEDFGPTIGASLDAMASLLSAERRRHVFRRAI